MWRLEEDLDKHYPEGHGGHGEAGGHKGLDMIYPEGRVEAMGRTFWRSSTQRAAWRPRVRHLQNLIQTWA